jgi:UPF0755 protein
MMRRVIGLSGVFVLLVVIVFGYVYVHRPAPGEPIVVEIASGSTTLQIAEKLQSEGVIGSTLGFRIAAKLRGLDGKIKSGRYELNKGMGVQAALDVLSRAPVEKGVAITFPEGFSLRQVAARVGARTQIKATDFLTAATNGTVRAPTEPPSVHTLEGFLFPETYVINERETAPDVLKRMVEEFDQRTSGLDFGFPTSRGLSNYQALIVASLIEREARLDEDLPKVAAVIYNRLAKKMRLQIDITAIYDLPQHKVPTRADLRRPSPYNTYLIDGLPPTPIANPGEASIDAALHPAPIDAIYYVVCEQSGRECFTNSAQEFERLKARRPAEVH